MDCNGCEFRPELYYDDQYQIWVRIEEDGLLAVGMTDISQTIAGRILHVRVRRPGTLRPAGKPVGTGPRCNSWRAAAVTPRTTAAISGASTLPPQPDRSTE